jgi:putative transposase
MPNYRRVKIKGGTYFLTLVTYDRRRLFFSSETRQLLLDSIEHVRKYHPFTMEAYCILPDHGHFLWRMPEDDDNYSMRIAEIKKRFSKCYLKAVIEKQTVNPSQIKRGESGLWQRRFWEHYIRDENDLNRHIDYIHYNPVKHGLVKRVKDWPSSSFSDYVQMGIYEINWGRGYLNDD